MIQRALLAFVLLIPLWAVAAIESREFDNAEQEKRYHAMIDKLRCLVCQNQNLADSNAELAMDLRDKTYNMIMAGNSDDEITEFMVSRYGEFVLYEPPLNLHTVILWGAPVILFLLGAIIFLRLVRSSPNRKKVVPDVNTEEAHRLLNTGERKDG